jgi:NAD(P)-dependent dehydrogenase (short-subunit alcohol dehydrogenase family)
MDPKGKTALITGGAHRVGKAITLALVRAGANVVINYHSSAAAAKETAAEAGALPAKG